MDQHQFVFDRQELRDIVRACEDMRKGLVNSKATTSVSYKEMDAVVNSLLSYECLFAYLFGEVFHYGKASDLLNPKDEVFAKYTLSASLVFSEPDAQHASIIKMIDSWGKVKVFLLENSVKINAEYNYNEEIIRLSSAFEKFDHVIVSQ